MKASPNTVLSEYRARLEEIYGERLVRLVLFGSQARGDANPDSDIDVMIVLSGPLDDWKEVQRTSMATSEVSLKYDTVISRTFATPDQADKDSGPFYEQVRHEGVLV
ncbi:MAG: nucleotidyltransferase domain-containing protein [Rhodospirillales bacterium]|jgi:predicted nucleotidyltransferase|nr:nucleotidyltransferase domain-containing protein [Rhodospirillales bacterium]HIJ44486.1 nucleotidyltransferase domain-containing protein [Rhodospirillaceae bacterium]MDP7098777.1 nucleotidyltransferase domain-containing protein [Rhodospirillales bacterium]MDP7215524.1 nucleotidyltransferase domain-containing protein [Rhodospirillales bacterium]HIJ46007.1 nucleotidyltransferase domain-containing protein [Rhodospirillaceae bacterium]